MGLRVLGLWFRVDRASLVTGVRTQGVGDVLVSELFLVVASDAAGDGERSVGARVADGVGGADAREAITELKRQLEEVAGMHVVESTFSQSGFDGVEVQSQSREFLFVGGKESLAKLFEL